MFIRTITPLWSFLSKTIAVSETGFISDLPGHILGSCYGFML